MRLEHPPGLPDEAQAFLERGGIELSIPLIVGRGLVGLYNLGPKLSGGPYNRYEVRLLHLLGGQAAVAVENSRLYADIKKSLEEKEVLLKEIHHRVKNNLQIVSSLLSLQSRYIKDKRMVEMLKDGQNRIKSMALVHEKLYQAGDLAKIDPSGYIRDLASYLLRSYEAMPGGVGLKVKADDVLMGIDTAIPCGLIISELVSNSLKHAFPLCAQNSADKTGCREDEIVIDLSSGNDGKFTLIVSDNGIGFPKDLDFRRTESMGLQLVNTLIDQIGGTIELDIRGGTEFKITFAEPKY
jgi:two-component sensor histidine kinase